MIIERTVLAVGLVGVLGLSGCVTPAQTTRKLDRRVTQLERRSSNQGLVDMMNQIQQLRAEVQQLRGETEAVAHGIDEVKKGQKDLSLDLDRRMSALEGGVDAGQPMIEPLPDESSLTEVLIDQPQEVDSPPSESEDAGQANDAAADDAANRTTDLYTDRPPVETAQPSSTTAAAKRVPGMTNEKAAYQDVFATLKQGRYDTAIEQFNEFLVTYPNGDYTDNAQYWLAEAYYVTRNFAAAQQGFQDVLDQHPHSAKAPDALLKIGFIEYEQAQWVAARDTLYDVMKLYPESGAARLANKRLSRMKNEKH